MGMGSMASFADAVPREVLRKYLPDEMQALEDLMRALDGPWETITSEKSEEERRSELLEAIASALSVEELAALLGITDPAILARMNENRDDACAPEEQQLADRVLAARRELLEEFNCLTRVRCAPPVDGTTALALKIYTHPSEDVGSCYDEVDGVFFHVENLYRLTEPGQEWKDRLQIERKFYTTFG